MENIKIIQEKFTKAEAKIVQSEIRKSPDITGYSIRELLRLNKVFKAYAEDEFTGACANFDFAGNWTELSAYMVLLEFRRQRIGKQLFAMARDDAVKRRRNIYVVSRNPIMIMILKDSGLKVVKSFWQLPRAVKIHILEFGISWYRVKEFLRKLPMKKSGKFFFGIKIANHNSTS